MVDASRWRVAQEAEKEHNAHRGGFLSREAAESRFREYWDRDIESIANEDVLSVGAGTGIIHSLELPNLQIGVDPLYSADDVNLDGSNSNNIIGAGESLPFQDGQFDTAISFNVLDHTQNPSSVLDEICRVLKRDGRFLFAVNTFDIPSAIRRPIGIIDTPHPHHFSTNELKQLLRDAGFDIVRFSSTPRFTDMSLLSLLRAREFKKIGGKVARIRLCTTVCHISE